MYIVHPVRALLAGQVRDRQLAWPRLGQDGVFGTGSEVELTRAWGVYASYDHVWWAGSKWRTSIYGGYVEFDYNDNAKLLISQATCGPFRANAGTQTPVFDPLPD